jgi:hypothetical protein
MVRQPLPAGKDLLNRRQAADWRGRRSKRGVIPGRNRLQELAGVTVFGWPAYPVADFELDAEETMASGESQSTRYLPARFIRNGELPRCDAHAVLRAHLLVHEGVRHRQREEHCVVP